MGIGDYLWPFDKEFSKIPCGRECAIIGLTGGPITGALGIIFLGKYRQAVPISVISGLAYFWVSFIVCRTNHFRTQYKSRQFLQALKSGKIDRDDD